MGFKRCNTILLHSTANVKMILLKYCRPKNGAEVGFEPCSTSMRLRVNSSTTRPPHHLCSNFKFIRVQKYYEVFKSQSLTHGIIMKSNTFPNIIKKETHGPIKM